MNCTYVVRYVRVALYALRTVHYALRTVCYALRTELYALRTELYALRSVHYALRTVRALRATRYSEILCCVKLGRVDLEIHVGLNTSLNTRSDPFLTVWATLSRLSNIYMKILNNLIT